MPTNYYPTHIEWHMPSEHAVLDDEGDTVYYDAEAQIVFKDRDGGETSILAVFFDKPKTYTLDTDGGSAFVDSFLAGFDARQEKDDAEDKAKIDMDKLTTELKTKSDAGFWMYDGSLTTPPCTSDQVNWTVMKGVLSWSRK